VEKIEEIKWISTPLNYKYRINICKRNEEKLIKDWDVTNEKNWERERDYKITGIFGL
jgi:hypothetical protein